MQILEATYGYVFKQYKILLTITSIRIEILNVSFMIKVIGW